MSSLDRLLKIVSPIRPQELRVTSGLGALAQTLRGGQQPAGQLLKQLQGKPGVKQGALTEVFGHIDPMQRLSPQELGSQAYSPRLFAQRGMTKNIDESALYEAAQDLMYGPEFAVRRAKIMLNLLADGYNELTSPQQQLFNRARRRQPKQWSPELTTQVEELAEEAAVKQGFGDLDSLYIDELEGVAIDIVRNTSYDSKNFRPIWGSYQRQDPSVGLTNADLGGGYFETVLRGQPSRHRRDLEMADAEGMHFSNPAQLGHIRGAASADPSIMILDEIQSDPLEMLGSKHPAMQGIYGQLGRMALDRAAEAGLNQVLIPDAKRIASVRDQRQLPFFESVYDKALGKELYAPLSARGVPVRYDNGWWSLSLDDRIREAIRQNEGILNYKRGGLAQVAQKP